MSNSLAMAFVGLFGIAFGAYLNSALARNRERWNLKRELYGQLLESLGELLHIIDIQGNWWSSGPPDDALAEFRKEREKELSAKEELLREKLRKTTSVATIMLPSTSLESLTAMQKQWATANDPNSDYDDYLRIHYSSTKEAYDSLVKAARRDLKIQRLADRFQDWRTGIAC